MTDVTVSIVVPVADGGPAFAACLRALQALTPPPLEIIVVADAPADGSGELARKAGLTVILQTVRSGPAAARNRGARAARGDVLFFVDADVLAPVDAVARVTATFSAGDIDAVIGSYDARPEARGFVSQYKNLVHRFVHQTAREDGFTFWGACGAVRRSTFLAVGGFDERFIGPSIEDIELGYRLRRRGHRIRVDRTLEVTHLKRWTLGSLVRTDIRARAIPWSELLLREGRMHDDLNLGVRTRIAIVLAWLALASVVAAVFVNGMGLVVLGLGLALVLLDLRLWRYFASVRGLWFAAAALPMQWLYYLYSGAAFAFVVARHLMRPRRVGREEVA